MKKLNRRKFLQTAAIGVSAGALSTLPVKAADKPLAEDRIGILIDTDVCVGCRHCEWACRIAHNLRTDNLESYSDNSVFKQYRRPGSASLTVVNEFKTKKILCSLFMLKFNVCTVKNQLVYLHALLEL